MTLRARRGIVGLASLDPRLQGTAPGLFARLHGVDPNRDKSFHNGQSANGDDRRGPSDVFVMRTRAGGWVKLAIVKRATQGGWNTLPVVVHWVHNPDASVFVKGHPPEFDKNGLAFGEPTEGRQQPGCRLG